MLRDRDRGVTILEMSDPAETIGYAEALKELEQILAEIEQDDVDIDVLAGRVKRASELIKLCRQRISGAQIEIQRIVAEMDEDPSAG